MSPLLRKFQRDLRQNVGQYAAIVLVLIAGISVAVMAFSTLYALRDAQQRYYNTAHFADVFATLRRAPLAVLDRIREIPGVQRADGRIVYGARVDIPGLLQPAFGQMLSLSETPNRALNAVLLQSGRFPERAQVNEAVLLESFAKAHGIQLGEQLSMVAGGRRITVTVVGIGASPEYILTAAPGDLIPDASRFAVVWMQRDVLGPLVDRDQAINNIVIDLGPDAREPAVLTAVERELAPYGALDVIGREDQPSHAYIDGEISQLRVIGLTFPPVFLAVAAYLLSVVMRRRVELERGQIGLLKAFGYNNREVATHYACHALVVAGLGVTLGTLAGYQLARMLNDLYADFYRFPEIRDYLSVGGVVVAGAAGFAASLAGVWMALRAAVQLAPAVAMSPAAPEVFRHRFIDLRKIVDAPTAMILRHLTRRPLRGLLTLTGLASAVALLVSTLFFFDSIRQVVDRAFFVSQRWEVSVAFDEPLPQRAYRWLARRDGVLRAEPQLAIRARLSAGPRSERIALTGITPQDQLQQIIGPHDGVLGVPVRGLVLSETLAGKLAVRAGDQVEVDVLDRSRPQTELPVTAISSSYVGLTAHIDRQLLQQLLGEDGPVSGVQLLLADDALDGFYSTLRELPHIASISTRDNTVNRFNEELIKSATTSMFIYIGFAGIVAFGVSYNAASIALSERARDLASLRVIGFTRSEAAYVLVGELLVLLVLALPLGAWMGFLLSQFFGAAMATDMYRFPVVVSNQTYATAALVVILSTALSCLMVVRRVSGLDLLEVLKTRE